MPLSAHVPDLTSLELLVAVAETGSLGGAGREFGLTQQAVSARMRSAETLVGVRLLRRGVRGTTLTDEGAVLVDWARKVLACADELDAAIAAVRGVRDGRLDLAASFTVAEFLLPPWLARLRSELGPQTGVNLTVRNSQQVAELVLTGRARLGFVEGPSLPDGLDTVTVATDQLVLVVPPGHRWARRRRELEAAELARTPLVTREVGSGTRTVLDRALADAAPDTERPVPSLVLSATTAIRQSVLAGAGPAVLSTLAVREDIRAGRLVRVRVTRDVDLRRELRGIWAEGPVPAGPARDLLRIARQAGARS